MDIETDTSCVFARDMLDDKHAAPCTKPWLFERALGVISEHDTEDEACVAQREWRTAHGYSPISGERLPPFWSVSIHLVDRRYGGPEEGGWYFTAGHPVEEIPEGINPHDLMTVFTPDSEVEAGKWAEALQLQLDTYPNRNRRSDIGSVLSEGRYDAIIQRGWPHAWPATRPHYE